MSASDDLLWGQVSDTLFCTKEQYLQSLSRFERNEVMRNNRLIGVVLTKGAEIHVAWMATEVMTRRLLRRYLGTVIEIYGRAETSVPKVRKLSHEFVKRLGFFKTHEDDCSIYYRIERMRHV